MCNIFVSSFTGPTNRFASMEDSRAPAQSSATITPLDQCGDTQRGLLESLLRHPAGLSVDQLVEKIGVTANAVRQHLTVLERDGLVAHEARPAPRGRPQHIYRLSERGQEAFPRRYRELAEAVMQELGEQLPGEALGRAMRRMGKRAAASFGNDRTPVPGVARLMKHLGYEATATSGNEIVARNCVFHQLARRFPSICEFDLAFMEAATGRKVEHRECMLRGGTCCRFRFTRN